MYNGYLLEVYLWNVFNEVNLVNKRKLRRTSLRGVPSDLKQFF